MAVDTLYRDVRQLDDILYNARELSESISKRVHEKDEPFWDDIHTNVNKAWENTDYYKACIEADKEDNRED